MTNKKIGHKFNPTTPQTFLIAILYTVVVRIFQHLIVSRSGLPPSTTTIPVWLVLIAPYFLSKKATLSMIGLNLAVSSTIITLNVRDGGDAIFTTVFSNILAALISEISYRFQEKHIKLAEERDRALVLAQRAAEAKSAFLANMSHEIRTPISGIMGLTELMSDESATPRQKELLSLINDSSDTLLNIVNTILDYSKIEAGRLELLKEPFSPQELFYNVGRNFELMAESKNLIFSSSLEGAIPSHLYGDRYRIRQILTNLLSNAIKYTEEGEVHFTVKSVTSEQSCNLTLSVHDTGIGIPQEYLSKIFQPFEQGESSYTKVSQGTGLGLAITKSIIDAMGGSIEIKQNRSGGVHAEVSLSLPLAEPAVAATPKRDPKNSDRKLHILLAEDNAVNQLYLMQFLSKSGYTVDLVEDGCSALEKAKELAYDAILMDIQMPRMSGIEATIKIREHEKSNNISPIPIFALTASATNHDRDRILAAGIDYFCPKPVDMGQLLSLLENL